MNREDCLDNERLATAMLARHTKKYPALDSVARLVQETEDTPENEEFYRRSAEVLGEVEEWFWAEERRDERQPL